MTKWKAHPYADLFPMMDPAELEALAADIAEHGLLQPIVRYKDLVLDGRNRLKGCEKANVDPRFTDFDGDDAAALTLVISLNVQRRDMTAGQRAIVAARAMPMFEKAAEERKKTGKSVDGEGGGRGKKKPPGQSVQEFLSRREAGKMFKVGEHAVQNAKTILANSPDLADEVAAKRLNITQAYEQHQGREEEKRRKEEESAEIAEYLEAISNGEMSIEEALQKALKKKNEQKEKDAVEADARSRWLKKLVEFVTWVEYFVDGKSDIELAWYTLPDSLGFFEHEITPERLLSVIAQLERVRVHTLGGNNES